MTAPEPSPYPWARVSAWWATRRRLARMATALDAMPEPTRTVFVMRLFDGLPCARIAGKLDLAPREVEAHIAAAIMLLANAARGQADTG
ncbi:sigma-70 region 4 domain-containing protein [Novosphingobium huizhouense]|uniref:sigma-70 region 4 domain-containing protein n=1 Tax=Novosphingobium huizhouense TaxID=2866625 RepID=UPI001CD8DEBF|nr:sigma-70 region 4 domain-containing protein [Novosphingobium huizhouense]